MLMVASNAKISGLKGRPPPRPCPDDFDVIFVEQGRLECEQWYRARKTTISRWLDERGKARLIAARATYVAHQRSRGEWMTRSTKLVAHHQVRAAAQVLPIRDRRKVSFILARHAAQFLRVVRNGGFIVSPSPCGDWRLGTRMLSPAQLVDFAISKGFDPLALQSECDAGVNER
jgi:hypothetical protein